MELPYTSQSKGKTLLKIVNPRHAASKAQSHSQDKISLQFQGRSGSSKAPNAGQHYKTARRQRLTGQNKDLQDLLVDPQYDALFDGSGETSSWQGLAASYKFPPYLPEPTL